MQNHRYMKLILVLFALLYSLGIYAQSDVHINAKRHQDSLNEVYINPQTSILSKKQLLGFEGLEFWDIEEKYRIKATFEPALLKLPVKIATSTGIPRVYHTYGTIFFEIDGVSCKLEVFQNPKFVATPGHQYKDHLLLGFTDQTSGDGSYGGGRYVDMLVTDIRKDDTVFIDFNKAYNPYCAYTEGYSCAIPPDENDLAVRIEAGVKNYIK